MVTTHAFLNASKAKYFATLGMVFIGTKQTFSIFEFVSALPAKADTRDFSGKEHF